MASFKLGQRVFDPVEKARGTVKYMGQIDDTKGSWVGVDWDNPDRGKHDGSHNGKRYFETATPTSGSFVREGKISSGISFEKSIEERYGGSADADPEEIESIRRDINAPFVELVGFDKVHQDQSNYALLKTISVRDLGVAHAGNDLENFVKSVNVLDLAENLFDSWDDIAKICKQLKRLRTLNVTENMLKMPKNTEDMKDAFANLDTLFMGKMRYDWSQCQEILGCMTNLKGFQAYYNNITTIPEFCTANTLTEINLSGNPLRTWDNVNKLSKLPRLQSLAVNDCQIEQITLTPKDPGFPSLKALQILGNKISDWQSISSLGLLPSLVELKCKDNPVVESESSQTARQLVIASIARLKVVNGTEVEKVERYGAEVDYLKKQGLEYLKALKSDEQNLLKAFHKKYPRYEELVQKYGAPEESELRVIDTSLKANLLKVNIVCPDDKSSKPWTKSLPPAMVLSKLRGLLTRMIKSAKGKDLVLSYTSPKKPEFEVPLDNDMRDLFFYNIESGDSILVRWSS